MSKKLGISLFVLALIVGFAVGAGLFLTRTFVVTYEGDPHRATEKNASTGLPFHLLPSRGALGTSVIKRLDENNWRYTLMYHDQSGKPTGFNVFRLRRVNAGKEYMDATAEIRRTH